MRAEIPEWVLRLLHVSVDPLTEVRPLATPSELHAPELRCQAPGSRAEAVARRVLDLAVAVPLLLLTSPALLAIAIAIRLESAGSPLFRQRRVGLGERSFVLYKFRSMRAHAEQQRHRDYVQALIRDGENGNAAKAGNSGLYKLVVDPRITRVGRFLRRTSLDELPQLLNVVRGEMSLVGPRPVILYEVEQYPDWYRERFAVKPGITGLWQVSGRNERTYAEMIRLDIDYVRERSLALDLKILLKTVKVVLTRQGAA